MLRIQQISEDVRDLKKIQLSETTPSFPKKVKTRYVIFGILSSVYPVPGLCPSKNKITDDNT